MIAALGSSTHRAYGHFYDQIASGWCVPQEPDVPKDYTREFDCNRSANDVFRTIRRDFSKFGNFVGNFGPGDLGTAIVGFEKGPVRQGRTIGISNVNLPPSTNLPAISFNVSVTVQSVSTTGFTFVTNPGHVLHPATISFSARDTGSGRISFSINVRGNFAGTASWLMYKAGGNDLEDKIWNNFIDNVQRSCGRKK